MNEHIKKASLALFFALCALIASGCTDAEVGSKTRPFSMYFVPSVDAQKVSKTASSLTRFVEQSVSRELYGKDKGFYVRASVPASYVAVIEAFGTHKADFAAVTTFSYILGRDIKKYPIEAALTVVRNHDEKTYKSQIIAHTDSGIKTLEDLNGKKFAFTDPASTSGYILPKKLLADHGVKLRDHVFAQKHDNVVTMVYQRQVDAGATFYSPPVKREVNGEMKDDIRDARMRVRTQFPDVEDKVKIIGFTMEIPNEPWIFRSNMYKDEEKNQKVKEAVIQALFDFSKTDDGSRVLKDLYDMDGLVRVTDADFEGIRSLVLASDLDLKHAVGKK